jgi:5-methylcytosine-specific restriction protein A
MGSAEPQRVCAEPRCPTPVAKGYCATHARVQRVQHQRFQTGGGLYGRPWRRARAAYLTQHPWCAGYGTQPAEHALATELDHVIPHRGDRALFWDEGNWQGLCDTCHGRKTADETLHAQPSMR